MPSHLKRIPTVNVSINISGGADDISTAPRVVAPLAHALIDPKRIASVSDERVGFGDSWRVIHMDTGKAYITSLTLDEIAEL